MRKEEWIHIITPENKNMIASPQYVKKLIGIDLSNIYNRVQRLEAKIDRLESPARQEHIVELLQENGEHGRVWIENRVFNFRGYDLEELIEKGRVLQGKSGTHRMYRLCESPKKDKT